MVACIVGVAAVSSISGGQRTHVNTSRTHCESCGAPFRASEMTCGHCRSLRTAYKPTSAPSPSYSPSLSPAPAPWPTYTPAPTYETPAPSPSYDSSPSFSSGGGGDFSGGGASGEF